MKSRNRTQQISMNKFTFKRLNPHRHLLPQIVSYKFYLNAVKIIKAFKVATTKFISSLERFLLSKEKNPRLRYQKVVFYNGDFNCCLSVYNYAKFHIEVVGKSVQKISPDKLLT